jgi:hypothetical protein
VKKIAVIGNLNTYQLRLVDAAKAMGFEVVEYPIDKNKLNGIECTNMYIDEKFINNGDDVSKRVNELIKRLEENEAEQIKSMTYYNEKAVYKPKKSKGEKKRQRSEWNQNIRGFRK